MMRKILTVVLMLAGVAMAQAQAKLKPVDNGSSVGFNIKNFGIKVDGSFTGLQGIIQFDPAKPEQASFDVTVDANSINTDNEKRDNHLRKEEYFNVEKFKVLHFKSQSVKKAADGKYHVDASITIKGVTKPVAFDFTATAKDGGYYFEGSFEINRRDFGVGGGSVSMADKLDVKLAVLAK